MKKMKLLCFIFFLFLLTGCDELITTEYEEVEVTIEKTYFEEGGSTPSMMAGNPISIEEDDEYCVTFRYNDQLYNFHDEKTYERYKGKEGQKAKAILKISTYNCGNNTIKTRYQITELK